MLSLFVAIPTALGRAIQSYYLSFERMGDEAGLFEDEVGQEVRRLMRKLFRLSPGGDRT